MEKGAIVAGARLDRACARGSGHDPLRLAALLDRPPGRQHPPRSRASPPARDQNFRLAARMPGRSMAPVALRASISWPAAASGLPAAFRRGQGGAGCLLSASDDDGRVLVAPTFRFGSACGCRAARSGASGASPSRFMRFAVFSTSPRWIHILVGAGGVQPSVSSLSIHQSRNANMSSTEMSFRGLSPTSVMKFLAAFFRGSPTCESGARSCRWSGLSPASRTIPALARQ